MGGIARLGFLGGTFDPIHVGHLLMAQTAYDTLGLDLVLFVPAGLAPHRQLKHSLDAASRLEMVRAAIAGDQRFELSTVDVDRPGPHYTADTLELLARRYSLPYDSIHFVMGSDSLAQLPTWHRPELIASRCRLAVIPRSGYPLDLACAYQAVPAARGRLEVIQMPEIGISSTVLRQMVREGQAIRYWVPDVVNRLILESGLYRQTAGAGTPVSL